MRSWKVCWRQALGLTVSLAGARVSRAQAIPDSAAVVSGIHDFQAACQADGGRLWGRSLCGPLLLVDPDTRLAVATERPSVEGFGLVNGVWEGQLPEGVPTANFALDWGGARWAMVLLPLPEDRYLRLGLLLHESFHRIQPQLGLSGQDLLSRHLDERNGRYWLRLELNALSAALRADGTERDRAVGDAILFRRYRYRLYPGADTVEASLERAEGLAEYTGVRLALDYLRLPESRAAQGVDAFQLRPTYIRSMAYGTGPALGLLLDHYVPGWRSRLNSDGFFAQLAKAVRSDSAPGLRTVQAAAERYGGEAVAKEEDAREQRHLALLADYRRRLIDEPVLLLRQTRLSRAFNPNALIAFGGEGTIYPTGSFNAEWGALEVDSGGALVAADFSTLRVPAPVDTSGGEIRGRGWKLKLSPGWRLGPGGRTGDLTAVAAAP
ncbi:MAG TPA: hypothetical protein VMG41_09915 [Gemmatimonadales bacterium]|nr:hypothetical protein [Gemmatimonadales bacterium]